MIVLNARWHFFLILCHFIIVKLLHHYQTLNHIKSVISYNSKGEVIPSKWLVRHLYNNFRYIKHVLTRSTEITSLNDYLTSSILLCNVALAKHKGSLCPFSSRLSAWSYPRHHFPAWIGVFRTLLYSST